MILKWPMIGSVGGPGGYGSLGRLFPLKNLTMNAVNSKKHARSGRCDMVVAEFETTYYPTIVFQLIHSAAVPVQSINMDRTRLKLGLGESGENSFRGHTPQPYRGS